MQTYLKTSKGLLSRIFRDKFRLQLSLRKEYDAAVAKQCLVNSGLAVSIAEVGFLHTPWHILIFCTLI